MTTGQGVSKHRGTCQYVNMLAYLHKLYSTYWLLNK